MDSRFAFNQLQFSRTTNLLSRRLSNTRLSWLVVYRVNGQSRCPKG